MTQPKVWRSKPAESFYVAHGMHVTAAALLAEVPDLAGHEALRLLLAAAGERASWLVGNPLVDPETADGFRRLVRRRRNGEPLQYIEGSVAFGPLELRADRRALIPRPETERLWELVLAEMAADPSVVIDLCTGSGNLALACKHSYPQATVYGVDISPAAIELANANSAELGLDVELRVGDLFDALPGHLKGRVDLLVSNPPYVAEGEVEGLPPEVREYEPLRALVAGDTGTEVLARIAQEAAKWMAPHGVVACEIGESQGADCMRLFAAYDPRIERDLAGRTRYVLGHVR
jgi:release factor glutamine methyltransferase